MPQESEDQSREWDRRARGYAALARRWPLLDAVVERAVAALPEDLEGRALDLGAGSGQAAARLSALRPRVRLVLVEPSPTMLLLARGRLGGRVVEAHCARAEEVLLARDSLAGALSCAAFHLMDPRAALARLAPALAPGARFACHLWGNRFAPTAGAGEDARWRAALGAALAELGTPAAAPPARPAYTPRTEGELRAAARAAGLELVALEVARDRARTADLLELVATSPSFLAALGPERRAAALERARALLGGDETEVSSVQLAFERRRTPRRP